MQLNYPTITVQQLNFKRTVLGNVSSPDNYCCTVLNERLIIPEAYALAVDRSTYDKRKTTTLIREHNEIREITSIDVTNKVLFDSPYSFFGSKRSYLSRSKQNPIKLSNGWTKYSNNWLMYIHPNFISGISC